MSRPGIHCIETQSLVVQFTFRSTTDLKKRAKLIAESSYNSLNSDFKEKMVKHPTKGLVNIGIKEIFSLLSSYLKLMFSK